MLWCLCPHGCSGRVNLKKTHTGVIDEIHVIGTIICYKTLGRDSYSVSTNVYDTMGSIRRGHYARVWSIKNE